MSISEKALIESITAAKDYWQIAHNEMLEDNQYYRSTYTLDLPPSKDITVIKIAKGAEVINRIRDHVPPSAVKIEGLPKTESQKSTETANKIENWLYGAIDEDNRRASRFRQMPPILETITLMFLRGMGVIKTVLNVSALEPTKRAGEDKTAWDKRYEEWSRNPAFPIPSFAVDPLAVFLDPGDEFAYEESILRVSEISRRMSNLGFMWESNQAMTTATFGEFWTPEEAVYLVDGKEIKRVPHRYGFLPYAIGFSGLGTLSSMTGEGDDGPQHLAVGLLRWVRAELKEVSQTMTAISWMRRLSSFPAGYYFDKPMEHGAQIKVTSRDELPGYVEMPDKLQVLIAYLEWLEDTIERKTAAAVLGGEMPKRQTTASEALGMLAEARLTTQNPVAALETIIEVQNEHKLKLLENIGDRQEQVTAYRLMPGTADVKYKYQLATVDLKPSDVNGWYRNKVTITPTSPQEQALKVNLALQLLAARLIDRADAARRSEVEDYPSMLQGTIEDAMIDQLTPAMVQKLAETFQLVLEKRRMMGQDGEMEDSQGEVASMLEEALRSTPSGLNAPPQMNAQTPTGQTAQLLGQAQQMPQGGMPI